MTRAGALLGATAAILLAAGFPAPADAQSPCGAGYTIRSGDTLYSIARRCRTSVSAIVEANARITDPNRIGAGWTIDIPGGGDGGANGSEPAGNGGGDGDAMTVIGTITGEGVECPALRGDDGQLYTLAGDAGRFGPGDRVRVRGSRAQMSICQQGTTIGVESIEAAR